MTDPSTSPADSSQRTEKEKDKGAPTGGVGSPASSGILAEETDTRNHPGELMRRRLLERFAPAAALINSRFQILHLHGPIRRFLQLPQGKPAFDLPSLLPEDVRGRLRTALRNVLRAREEVAVTGLRMQRDGQAISMGFTVGPVPESDTADPLLLVTFHAEKLTDTGVASSPATVEADRVAQLEADLKQTQNELRHTIEDLEAVNAELTASNEETMSMNEELQSANEELETSQAELQSMNEELHTVNAELREKIQQLETAHNDLNNLMDGTEIATLFLDRNFAIRRYTPAAKALFHLIPTDVGRPIGDLNMRFNDPDLRTDARKVLETPVPVSREIQNDEGRWFIRRLLPFRTRDHRVDGLVLTFSDVTELKTTEKALRQSERKFRNIAENVPGLVLKYQLHPDGSDNLLYLSKGVEALYELPWEEAFHNVERLWTLIHPEDRDGFEASVKESAERLSIWERDYRIQMPDGRVKWLYSCGVPTKLADGSVMWDTLTIDVTNQKQAEERLRRSRAMLARTQRIAHVGSWEWEIEGDRVTWSEELFRVFGMDPAQTPPSWAEHAVLYPPEDMARLREAVETARVTGEPFEIELRPIRRDGDSRFALARGVPEKDAAGRVVRFYGFLQDITDLKRSEAALRESEERLRRIVENMPVLFNAVDAEGRIIAWNRESERGTGYSAAEILHRRDVGRLLYPNLSDRPSVFIRPEEPRPNFREKEHTLTRKDGERRTIAWSNVSKEFPIPGWHSWAIGIDVTRRKQAEADLREALAEKEVLLREIHHRVKNNMQVISGLLRMHARMSEESELKQIFEDCRNRVSAMALIHEALYEATDVTRIDFGDYLAKLCRNLGRVYEAPGHGVEVRVNRPPISLSLDQGVAIGMVVSELVSNAFKHAFPLNKGGRVTVELDSPETDTAELIVADNGKGLPPEVDLEDPTTLGLGLELATDAVRRELGGTISVSSGPGARYAIRFQIKVEP